MKKGRIYYVRVCGLGNNGNAHVYYETTGGHDFFCMQLCRIEVELLYVIIYTLLVYIDQIVAAQIDECHMKIVDKPAMIIELKWKKNAGTSIKQIKDKKYVAGLEGYHGKVLLVGISYDKLMRGETDKIKEHSCSIGEIEM